MRRRRLPVEVDKTHNELLPFVARFCASMLSLLVVFWGHRLSDAVAGVAVGGLNDTENSSLQRSPPPPRSPKSDRLIDSDQNVLDNVEPWMPDVVGADGNGDLLGLELTTSGESFRGGTDRDGLAQPLPIAGRLDDDWGQWYVGTASPCNHPLDECTFVINGEYPFAGLFPGTADDTALSDASQLQKHQSIRDASTSKAETTGKTSAAAAARIHDDNRVPAVSALSSISVSNDVHVIPEHPEDPCVVAGRVEATNNWFGYLGVFRLRRSSSTTANFGSSSGEMSSPSTPARLYFRVVYPIVNGGKNVPVSLLFYLGEQVRSLNVRMNCFQRLQLVDQRGPQVIRLDPAVAQSGCINRTRTASDFVGGVRGGRSGSGAGGDSAEWTTVVDCRGGRLLRSNVERQWNVAVSSCGSPRGLVLSYTLVVYGHVGRCPSNPSLSGAEASTRVMASLFDTVALFVATIFAFEITRLHGTSTVS